MAIRKRPEKGLLAGLYELPNIEEHLNKKEITQYCKEIGLMPIHIKKLPAAKHIFSHIEWQMQGYLFAADTQPAPAGCVWASPEQLAAEYTLPGAFKAYKKLLAAAL